MSRAIAPALVLLLAVSVLPAHADPAGTCSLLGEPITSGAPLSVQRFAVGDFNEDGILDLVLIPTTLTFSVELGLGTLGVGNGQFGPGTPYSTPSQRDVAVGDFNHDGILDLALSIPNAVTVRFGQGAAGVGDGTFGSQTDYLASTDQQPILVGDFDEDGILDLVYATGNGPYTVTVRRGNGANGIGNGTFASPVSVTVVAVPSRFVTGDFNQDGRKDLAMLAGGNAITTLRGTGTGPKGDGGFNTATNYVVNALSTGLVTGDFNGDGRTDLAFTEAGGDVAVMLGNGTGSVGDGTFAAPTRYWVGLTPRGLGVVDLTGDGIADLAVSLQADSIAVMVGGGSAGVGNGTFVLAQRFKCAPGPRALKIGDFNEDGIPDVLVANFDTTAVQVFPGVCPPSVPTTVAVSAPNGLESWQVGSEHTISWTRGAGVIAADVEISRDGGKNWDPVTSNETGTSFAWTVTGPPTAQALVRVHDSTVPGRADVSDTIFVIEPNVSSVADRAPSLELGPPSPNPFSRSVRITLSVPRPLDRAEVVVCGVDGRVVARMHSGPLGTGPHTLEWNGRLTNGRRAAPGVYFVRASWPGADATQRAVLLE